MPRLDLESAVKLVKDTYEKFEIGDIVEERDVDSGGSWDVAHVVTISGKNADNVLFRAKLRFPTSERHFYVKGMGYMGKVAHFEVSASFPFNDLPPIDLACGSLVAKVNLMRTQNLVIRTINRAWRGDAHRIIPEMIENIVICSDNEKSIAAFADIVQMSLVADQEVGNEEDCCLIET